jgi:predicted O-methyltransferase YrrM
MENLKAAGVDNKVTIIVGRAAESLTKLSSEGTFDLVFIDADKPSNTIYFSEAKRLVRKGGIIVRVFHLSISFPVLLSLT